MTARTPLAGAALLVAAAHLAACESTQGKSARLERKAAKVSTAKGLRVTKRSREIKVGRTAVISDVNGSAAVVELRNTSGRALSAVPVAITVRDRRRKVVYANDAPGLDSTLIEAPLVASRGRLLWVNDQVVGASKSASVRALVGADAKPAPGSPPRIEVKGARIEGGDVSGVAAKGEIVNRSRIEQRRLVVYAVVRRRGRIVAAGRAILPRVRPGKAVPFTVFFIGDPRRGRLTIDAPPTVL